MITIHFSQCDDCFCQDSTCQMIATMPMIRRCQQYEEVLRSRARASNVNGTSYTLCTTDETLLLVALSLKRKGVIRKLQFVDYCKCGAPIRKLKIDINANGEMEAEPFHPLFDTYNRYLREGSTP